jgi:hypothetical protein
LLFRCSEDQAADDASNAQQTNELTSSLLSHSSRLMVMGTETEVIKSELGLLDQLQVNLPSRSGEFTLYLSF